MTRPDLLTASYQYELPDELIAHRPIDKRDQSRLLVMNGPDLLEDRIFSDLPAYLSPGDCLVINDTRVIPARLHGSREKTGGAVELLLLTPLEGNVWRALAKPGKSARPGDRLVFGQGRIKAEIQAVEPDGSRLVSLETRGPLLEALNEIGEMPLPPYIHEKLADPGRYQTVYANQAGSAAAPTAGLHFTENLLETIQDQGVEIARVTLHVGLGTFRPVKESAVRDHIMHYEPFTLDRQAVQTVLSVKKSGGRVIAVGTTSCRLLESAARRSRQDLLEPQAGETDLFIYPGFEFKVVDALITNFHLPGSTLLMLVSALMGREPMLAAYQHAIRERYRFFSFGDAMLLLPQGAARRRETTK